MGKKSLMAQKMQLYRDANAKSETEKKAATVAAKTLYTKAYAKYCVGTKLTSDPVCTNDLMKKMYGHPGRGALISCTRTSGGRGRASALAAIYVTSRCLCSLLLLLVVAGPGATHSQCSHFCDSGDES